MIIWFIGMSGAGKTTLGRGLYERLKPTTRHLVYLDGDEFREVFKNDADHTLSGRNKNAERISHFCRTFDRERIHVIASVLSIFPEWQAWNRKEFSSYFEIFIDIPLDTLRARDPKGLYRNAAAGNLNNVVGVDIPFPKPLHPDLIIGEQEQIQGIDACVEHVLKTMPALD
jgi:adenylylsulfate kinase-like enzyme